MNPEPYNFIVVEFGDNDFGNQIKDALVEGVEYWGLDKKACPIIWKQFIIEYLTSYGIKRRIVDGREMDESHMRYLNEKYFQRMRVKFEINAPTDDFDGGSAAYNMHTKYAWTY